jgi:hypothetical protein
MPGKRVGTVADEPEIPSELGRADPPFGIRFNLKVGAVPECVNPKTDLVVSKISDPDFRNAYFGVGMRERSQGLFSKDFYDQIGTTFNFQERL